MKRGGERSGNAVVHCREGERRSRGTKGVIEIKCMFTST